MGRVSRSAEDISEVIFLSLVNVFLLRNSMVIFAIDTFSARASCEIHAEVSAVLLLKVICFCISSVDLWLQLRERRSSFDFDIAISQVLVVPNVVVIISFFICGVLFAFVYLFSRWSLHPFMNLEIFEFSKLI